VALIAVLLLGAVYEVGDGKTYAGLTDVPWETLAPQDEVRVHARAAPYAAKWLMARPGVIVRGVPDGSGALPVVTGLDAATRSGQTIVNPDRTLVMVDADDVVLENLHFRRAHQGDPFTLGNGAAGVFAGGVTAVDAVGGARVTVRGCIIEDFEKGLYVATDDAVIEGNVFRSNRAGGNLELEGARPVVRFNALLVPVDPDAENVRDNSSGAVIAYNFISGGNRVIDIEGIGAPPAPEFTRTRVFGNVLIKSEPAGNFAVIHFDTQAGGRTLELHSNTIVARRTVTRVVNFGLKAGLRMKLVNNVVRGPSNGTLVLADGNSPVEYGGNWLQTGRILTQTSVGFTDLGGNIDGDSPGFRDESADDFRLAKGAAVIDKAIALPVGLDVPVFEFRTPAGSAPRGDDLKPDIGAFEETPAVVTPDGGAGPGQAGLVGWRVCAAAPGPAWVLVVLLLIRRRRVS